MIPKSLRVWFTIHFIVDMLFAIPLIVFPTTFLSFFGFTGELMFARLVGAALIGIGGASYFTQKKESFKIMLQLKLLWSGAAIVAILWSIIEGTSVWAWLFLVIFCGFFGVWMYYKVNV
jgi:hypothetical protein